MLLGAGGTPGANDISMYADADFTSIAWAPAGWTGFTTEESLFGTNYEKGVYCFRNLDPGSLVALSFLHAVAAAADPNNTVAIARLIAFDEVRISPSECEVYPSFLGDWEVIAGNLALPTASKLLPQGTADTVWKWADSISVMGTDRSLAPGLRVEGDEPDCRASGLIDLAGHRNLLVMMGQAALAPSAACVPLLRQL